MYYAFKIKKHVAIGCDNLREIRYDRNEILIPYPHICDHNNQLRSHSEKSFQFLNDFK